MKNLNAILILMLILGVACKSKEEILKDQINENITIYVKSMLDSTQIMERIVINKIDTITPKEILEIQLNKHFLLFEFYVNQSQRYLDIAKEKNKYVWLTVNDPQFAKTLKEDFDEAKARSMCYSDSANLYDSKIQNLFKEIETCIDTLTFKYYLINYNVKGHLINLEAINMDSLEIGMDKDLHIIQFSDMK